MGRETKMKWSQTVFVANTSKEGECFAESQKPVLCSGKNNNRWNLGLLRPKTLNREGSLRMWKEVCPFKSSERFLMSEGCQKKRKCSEKELQKHFTMSTMYSCIPKQLKLQQVFFHQVLQKARILSILFRAFLTEPCKFLKMEWGLVNQLQMHDFFGMRGVVFQGFPWSCNRNLFY